MIGYIYLVISNDDLYMISLTFLFNMQSFNLHIQGFICCFFPSKISGYNMKNLTGEITQNLTICDWSGLPRPVVFKFLYQSPRNNQSPRIIDFRYYLRSAGCGYLSIYLSGYRCPFDCSHTIQPTALKLWHNIPHVYNSRRFFFKFLKNKFQSYCTFSILL